MLALISTLVLVIIGLGLRFRFRRRLHISLMLTAFVIDLGLVLVIEFQRHAVEQIISPQVAPFTVFHAVISLIVLILYIVMLTLGIGIIKNRPGARQAHRWGAGAFVVFRLANYVTSFML